MKMVTVQTSQGDILIPSIPRDDWEKSKWGFWLYLNKRAMKESDGKTTKHENTNGYLLSETLSSCFGELWGHLPWITQGKNDYQTIMIKLKKTGHTHLMERQRPSLADKKGASIWWIAEDYEKPAPVVQKPQKRVNKQPAVLEPVVKPEKNDLLTQIMHNAQTSKTDPISPRPTVQAIMERGSYDPELTAISVILAALLDLSPEQRLRVMNYIANRLDLQETRKGWIPNADPRSHHRTGQAGHGGPDL